MATLGECGSKGKVSGCGSLSCPTSRSSLRIRSCPTIPSCRWIQKNSRTALSLSPKCRTAVRMTSPVHSCPRSRCSGCSGHSDCPGGSVRSGRSDRPGSDCSGPGSGCCGSVRPGPGCPGLCFASIDRRFRCFANHSCQPGRIACHSGSVDQTGHRKTAVLPARAGCRSSGSAGDHRCCSGPTAGYRRNSGFAGGHPGPDPDSDSASSPYSSIGVSALR